MVQRLSRHPWPHSGPRLTRVLDQESRVGRGAETLCSHSCVALMRKRHKPETGTSSHLGRPTPVQAHTRVRASTRTQNKLQLTHNAIDLRGCGGEDLWC